MSEEGEHGFSTPLSFRSDPSSKRKKGAHRPQYAPVFEHPPSNGAPPTKVHLFVNPFSGKKHGRKVAQLLLDEFNQRGVTVEASFSDAPGHLIQLASEREVGEGEVIAVVGGDGSLCEVMTGRMQRCPTQPEWYAIVPAGTGNSQAHDLGLSDVSSAVAAMLSGKRQALDLARVELTEGLPGSTKGRIVRYCHNLVTWGLGVDSNIQAEKMRWLGPTRYDIGILLAILANRKRRATLVLDGVSVEDDFTLFLVQNSQTGGSKLPLAPGATLDDGRMDIGLLKNMSRRQILKAFGMLKSEGRHVFHPRVDYHRFSTLEILTTEPTAINIDGENLGSTPLSMEVLRHAAFISVPASE